MRALIICLALAYWAVAVLGQSFVASFELAPAMSEIAAQDTPG
ncbi:hypothetical protein [Hyphococcus sp.]